MPGLEDRHLHAPRHELGGEPLAHGLDGVLGGGVARQQRARHPARQRRDVDDLAVALPAQVRRGGADHAPLAREVGVELAADLGVGQVLLGAEQAVAGVVDEHVEPTEAARPSRRRTPPSPAESVTSSRTGMDAVLVAVDHRLGVAIRVAHGGHHDVAARRQLPSGGGAEAARAAGDEHDVLAAPRVRPPAPGGDGWSGARHGPRAPLRHSCVPLLVGHRRADAGSGGRRRCRPASAAAAAAAGRRCRRGRRRRWPARAGWRPARGTPRSRRGDELAVGLAVGAVGDVEVGRLPVAGEHPRLEDAHLDAEGADLEPQPLGQRFEGVLGGGVVGQHRRHDADPTAT